MIKLYENKTLKIMTTVSKELKTELVQLASNLKHHVDNYRYDNRDDINYLFSDTRVIPTFLNDIIKNKLVLAQDTCDFDIKEMVDFFQLRGPEFDLSSDIKDKKGVVYQSFKVGKEYHDGYGEHLLYNEGYVSGQNARLLITEDMPILYEALKDYRIAYNHYSMHDEDILNIYAENNKVNIDMMYNMPSKEFDIFFTDKNEAIKQIIKYDESGEFMHKVEFNEACKNIEKKLNEQFTQDNKNKNDYKI